MRMRWRYAPAAALLAVMAVVLARSEETAQAVRDGLALCALAENDTDSALSYIEEGLKTAEDSDRENLLFNQIVSYEKRADFDTAKSLMADFLAAYPENTAAQRENTFLQNR